MRGRIRSEYEPAPSHRPSADPLLTLQRRVWSAQRVSMSVVAPIPDRAGRTDLHYAALEGRLRDVVAAIEAGDDVHLADTAGFTPLHFAAQRGHAGIVELLVASGADIESRNEFGNTPLWVAVMNTRDGDGATVAALLAAGADADAANNSGNSPRDVANRVANYDLRRFFDR